MARIKSVHLIDSDYSRRTSIARELFLHNLHTESYRDINEFAGRIAPSGAVFAFGGLESDVRYLLDLIGESSEKLLLAMFARSPSPAVVACAMTLGATAYLEWPFAPGELERVIGDMMRPAPQRANVVCKAASARKALGRLSRRETVVLWALVEGCSTDAIARELSISPGTVELHRANLMAKLDARSLADVVRLAIYASADCPEDSFANARAEKASAITH